MTWCGPREAFGSLVMDRTSVFVPLAIGNAGRSMDFARLAEYPRTLTSSRANRYSGARAAGHSWTEIGEALGVVKQTAWEPYSDGD